MGQEKELSIELEFQDNRLLPLLFGERDRYLQRLQVKLGVEINSRGNRVLIQGARAEDVNAARFVLEKMYGRLEHGQVVSVGEIDAAIRLFQGNSDTISLNDHDHKSLEIATRRRTITPRTPSQIRYINTLKTHDLTFAVGPAGTGKTYLATALAVSHLLSESVERIILSRPAVEAGEKLGFLPGDMREKIDPYLRPLYDALYDMLPAEQVEKRIASGEIEIAPLAFMRGRTLSRAFVILDEAQNTTTEQMKMFLTRLGEDSRMVVNGDLTQIDLPKGGRSGLVDALEVLKGVEGIGVTYFDRADVLRHGLVRRIVAAYEEQN